MSFREVNQLRKNGQIEEAYTMAMADLEKEQSTWTYSALFWVLKDKCDITLNEKNIEEAQDIFQKMENILPLLNDEQGFAKRSLNFIKKKLVPHAAEVKEADRLSKEEGLTDEAYHMILPIFERGELIEEFHTSFGWIIYRYLKAKLSVGDVLSVKQGLSNYMKLQVERPSILHSSILRMAIDLENNFKNEFKFTNFFAMWGMDNFTEEDWEQAEGMNGEKFNSIVERVVFKYSAELKDDNITNVPEEYNALLDKVIARYKKPLYTYYKARLLATTGKKEEALSLYRQLVATMGQPYLWNDIATLVDDPKLKKAAICKYILAQREEQYLGNSHLKLGAILTAEGDFPGALFEIEKYKENCAKNGYHLKNEYYQVRNSIPQNTKANTDNQNIYRSCANDIEEFIFADSPLQYLVVTDIFIDSRNNQIAILQTCDNVKIRMKARALRKTRQQQFHIYYIGRVVNCGRTSKVVGLTQANEQDVLQSFPHQTFSGDLRTKTNNKNKRFGFVNNCYVSERLLTGLVNDDKVTVVAIKGEDGKFSAISIKKQ